jgi:hypothetical protein
MPAAIASKDFHQRTWLEKFVKCRTAAARKPVSPLVRIGGNTGSRL